MWFEQSSVYLSFITLARVIPNMETVLMQFFHIILYTELDLFCEWKICIKIISRWSVYCAFICNVFETFSLNLSPRKLLIQFQNFKFKTSRTINVPLTCHFSSPFSSGIFLSQAWTYYYYIRSLLITSLRKHLDILLRLISAKIVTIFRLERPAYWTKNRNRLKYKIANMWLSSINSAVHLHHLFCSIYDENE